MKVSMDNFRLSLNQKWEVKGEMASIGGKLKEEVSNYLLFLSLMIHFKLVALFYLVYSTACNP